MFLSDISISSCTVKCVMPAGLVPPMHHVTSSTPTKWKFYFTNSFATYLNAPGLYRQLTFQIPNYIFCCLGCSKESVQGYTLCNILYGLEFYGELLLTIHPTHTGGPSLASCLQLLIQYNYNYPYYLNTFFFI